MMNTHLPNLPLCAVQVPSGLIIVSRDDSSVHCGESGFGRGRGLQKVCYVLKALFAFCFLSAGQEVTKWVSVRTMGFFSKIFALLRHCTAMTNCSDLVNAPAFLVLLFVLETMCN